MKSFRDSAPTDERFISAFNFSITYWRGKDRWLNRPHPPMREIELVPAEIVENEGAEKEVADTPPNPQAIFVALDHLKNMREEGETLLTRCYFGKFPTWDELKDFIKRTRTAVRERVFEKYVDAKALALFEQEWDKMVLLRKRAELVDAGRIINKSLGELLTSDDHEPQHLIFDRLYSRVQRLTQLLEKIEGMDTGNRRGPADFAA